METQSQQYRASWIALGNSHKKTSTLARADGDHTVKKKGLLLRKSKYEKSLGIPQGFQLNVHLSKMFC